VVEALQVYDTPFELCPNAPGGEQNAPGDIVGRELLLIASGCCVAVTVGVATADGEGVGTGVGVATADGEGAGVGPMSVENLTFVYKH
jgi:hypothetical protein